MDVVGELKCGEVLSHVVHAEVSYLANFLAKKFRKMPSVCNYLINSDVGELA
jgi:hypothetical protein